MMNLSRLEEILRYEFRDRTWLQRALTHPSCDQRRATNLAYERLEYLGDAVLELVVSRELFILFPKADEGQLTQFRSRVVSRAHLASKSREFGFGKELAISAHEEKNGGRDKESILANTFETIIGAVMMDGDYPAARRVALRLLNESIRQIGESPRDTNSKGELQIVLQAVNGEAPVYKTRPVTPDVEFPFVSSVFWQERHLADGNGPTKRKAEADAAARALASRAWEGMG